MTKSMKARAQHEGPGTIWQNAGKPAPRADPVSPVRAADPVLRLTPTALIPWPAPRLDAWARGCRLFDRLIAAASLASNEPVLDVRDFGWTADLRRAWPAIRDEALALAARRTTPEAYENIPLWRDGRRLEGPDATCPHAMDALAAIPELHDAAFALLAPNTHVLPRRGATKALITCHLGLVVARDGGARMRVRDRIVRWAEGQTLVFDDTYEHEAWNEAQAMRIVLRLRVARPLRQPGRAVARGVLRMLRGGA